jgi:hypothetical protein
MNIGEYNSADSLADKRANLQSFGYTEISLPIQTNTLTHLPEQESGIFTRSLPAFTSILVFTP